MTNDSNLLAFISNLCWTIILYARKKRNVHVAKLILKEHIVISPFVKREHQAPSQIAFDLSDLK